MKNNLQMKDFRLVRIASALACFALLWFNVTFAFGQSNAIVPSSRFIASELNWYVDSTCQASWQQVASSATPISVKEEVPNFGAYPYSVWARGAVSVEDGKSAFLVFF